VISGWIQQPAGHLREPRKLRISTEDPKKSFFDFAFTAVRIILSFVLFAAFGDISVFFSVAAGGFDYRFSIQR